jgi:hypothetical protein
MSPKWIVVWRDGWDMNVDEFDSEADAKTKYEKLCKLDKDEIWMACVRASTTATKQRVLDGVDQ